MSETIRDTPTEGQIRERLAELSQPNPPARTATPWRVEARNRLKLSLYAGNRTYLGVLQRETDAAYIVHCVNQHDQLVAALRLVRDKLNLLVAMDNCNYERDAMRHSGGFDEARQAVMVADSVLATTEQKGGE